MADVYFRVKYPMTNTKKESSTTIQPLLFDSNFYRYTGINASDFKVPNGLSYNSYYTSDGDGGSYQFWPTGFLRTHSAESERALTSRSFIANEVFGENDAYLKFNYDNGVGVARTLSCKEDLPSSNPKTHGNLLMKLTAKSEVVGTKSIKIPISDIKDASTKRLAITISRPAYTFTLQRNNRSIRYNIPYVEYKVIYDPVKKQVTLDKTSTSSQKFYIPKKMRVDSIFGSHIGSLVISENPYDINIDKPCFPEVADGITTTNSSEEYGFVDYFGSANSSGGNANKPSTLINDYQLGVAEELKPSTTSSQITLPVFADHAFKGMCMDDEMSLVAKSDDRVAPSGDNFKFFTNWSSSSNYKYHTPASTCTANHIQILSWIDLVTSSSIAIGNSCITDDNELVLTLICGANRTQSLNSYSYKYYVTGSYTIIDHYVSGYPNKVWPWSWYYYNKKKWPDIVSSFDANMIASFNIGYLDMMMQHVYGGERSRAFVAAYDNVRNDDPRYLEWDSMLYCSTPSTRHKPTNWNPDRTISVTVKEL